MSDGFTIDVLFDQNTTSLPAEFVTAVNAVVQYYESVFTAPASNPITLTIHVGYGEVDGQPVSNSDLGESIGLTQTFTYTQVANALTNDLASATAPQPAMQAALNSLPTSSPFNGTLQMTVANATALGLLSGSMLDGYVGFSTTANFDYAATNSSTSVPAGQDDFFGTVAHEISEVMGRVSDLDQFNIYSLLDLYRYSAPGVRNTGNNFSQAYFSIDGGNTNLDNFNTKSSGDFGDWATNVPANSYDAFASSGVVNAVTPTDLEVMNALGYQLSVQTQTTPMVTGITELPAIGTLGAGKTVTITLDFNEAVIVTGTPTLTLNDNATATFASGSDSGALAFTYIVAATDSDVTQLAVASINLDGGSISDSSGNAATLSLAGIAESGPAIDTDVNFIEQCYQIALLRQAGASEINYWVGVLETGGSRLAVAHAFAASPEAQTFVLPVVETYQAVLDRAPDAGGLAYWSGVVHAGATLTTIVADFLGSAEFQNAHGGLSATAFVTLLYENVLGRAPDSGGQQYWAGIVAQGNDGLAVEAAVTVGFITSAEALSDSTQPIETWLTNAAETGSYAASIPGINGAAEPLGTSSAGAGDTIVLSPLAPQGGVEATGGGTVVTPGSPGVPPSVSTQAAAPSENTTAAAGGHDVFFVMPAAPVDLNNTVAVAATLGKVTTVGTDNFVVILDNAPTAAASTAYGIYAVTAHEPAGGTIGSNPADSVQLIGVVPATGGFTAHGHGLMTIA